ncbi:sperm flagellar protein 1-like [Patiria miniata]|uniref:Calponin-homology (CH) domain-containing protein n=1 Tax=Patiria miniata TaxID=46514 RepID=A0A913Z387_PATMI|nr:sperm flagellar protein 1-like [Patiria miniata]
MGEIVPTKASTTDTNEAGNMTDLDDEKLQDLYAWVDEIPLSRAKRNMTRDFSDGVLVAEIVHHFVPKIVDVHNYSPANSTQQKMSNWGTLNRKVFPRIGFNMQEVVVRSVCNSKPGVVEAVLWQLRHKIDLYLRQTNKSDKLSPDGYYGGKEVGSGAGKADKTHGRAGGSKAPKHPPQAPKAPTVHAGTKGTSHVGRVRSINHTNEFSTEFRLLLEEKEQNLLASQETVQILQAKVRRLEQLLQLKDIRIEEQAKRIEQLERRY